MSSPTHPRSPAPLPGAATPRLAPGLRVPLYQQIVVILRDRILGGSLGPGARLPGEHELAAAFGVSRITAKRALDELAEAGLVRRGRGRGTEVLAAPALPEVRVPLEGWLENAQHIGRVTRAEVLEFGYGPAPRDIAAALALPDGAEVQRAVRVRRLQDAPMSHLVTHVPRDIGAGFDAADLAATPLLALLERAGVTVASARQTISATLAEPGVATALELPAGAPLIEVLRTVIDSSGRPVEHIRVLYRPDIYRIEMALRRVPAADGMRWSAETASLPDALTEGDGA